MSKSSRREFLSTGSLAAGALAAGTGCTKGNPSSSTGAQPDQAGQIKDSLLDFDRYVKLAPSRASRQWERGITCYYAAQYKKGAAQFELYQTYQGIDTLHILPRLPGSVDGTGHIDMWFYLVDEDTVIISEFIPGSNATAK